jgi:hypothetical protein
MKGQIDELTGEYTVVEVIDVIDGRTTTVRKTFRISGTCRPLGLDFNF